MDNFDLMIKNKIKTEKFELPGTLDMKIKEAIDSLPEKKTSKKRPLFAAIAAAVIIVSSVTIVYAKDIPLINTVIEFFKGDSNLQYSGDAEAFEKYSVGVNKTITDNGVSITIDNIACDDNFLVLFYTVKGEGQKSFQGEGGVTIINGIHGDITIDGIQKSISNNDNFDAYIADDGTVKGMIRADISGDSLKDNSRVDFLVSDALGKDGKWDFKLDVSKEYAMKDTKIVKVNKEASISFPGGRTHDINIEKVSFTPFGNQIIINEKFKSQASKYDKLNDTGTPLEVFALFDDKGNALDVLNFRTVSGPDGARNSFEFIKGSKDSKYLTLVPIFTYADNAPKEINYKPVVDVADLDKFPLELKMSSKGSLTIQKIEYGENETKVYYVKNGVVLFVHFSFIDDKGKDAFEHVAILHKDYIVDRENGIHVRVFPKLDKSKKYKLSYITDEKINLLYQQKIVIPLADS